MRLRIRRLVVFVALVGSCSSLSSWAQETTALEDGLYLISRAGMRRVEVMPVFENEQLLIHDYRFLDKGFARSTPQQLIVVGRTPEVALALAAAPRSGVDEQERSFVRLQLAEKAAADLRQLTEKHPGRGIAIVLDDQIVQTLKITAAIDDGRLEIVGCREGAGEHLERRLLDHVVPKKVAGEESD